MDKYKSKCPIPTPYLTPISRTRFVPRRDKNRAGELYESRDLYRAGSEIVLEDYTTHADCSAVTKFVVFKEEVADAFETQKSDSVRGLYGSRGLYRAGSEIVLEDYTAHAICTAQGQKRC